MFCRNCGKELEDGSMFCGNCGAKLTQGIYPYNEEPVEMPDQNMENTENNAIFTVVNRTHKLYQDRKKDSDRILFL